MKNTRFAEVERQYPVREYWRLQPMRLGLLTEAKRRLFKARNQRIFKVFNKWSTFSNLLFYCWQNVEECSMNNNWCFTSIPDWLELQVRNLRGIMNFIHLAVSVISNPFSNPFNPSHLVWSLFLTDLLAMDSIWKPHKCSALASTWTSEMSSVVPFKAEVQHMLTQRILYSGLYYIGVCG